MAFLDNDLKKKNGGALWKMPEKQNVCFVVLILGIVK